MEHYNLTLKQRLESLGGRYTEEAIERIGASLTLAEILEDKVYPKYTDRYIQIYISVCFLKHIYHLVITIAGRLQLGSLS